MFGLNLLCIVGHAHMPMFDFNVFFRIFVGASDVISACIITWFVDICGLPVFGHMDAAGRRLQHQLPCHGLPARRRLQVGVCVTSGV